MPQIMLHINYQRAIVSTCITVFWKSNWN